MNQTNDKAFNIIIITSLDDVESPEGFECYFSKVNNMGSTWQGENPLTELLPKLVAQIFVINVIIRLLLLVLRRFNQPRFVAQILAGIIIGPTLVGRIPDKHGKRLVIEYLYPFKSQTVLETMAYISLVFYMFFIGLQMDLTMVLRTGKKAATIALCGILIPLSVGGTLYMYVHKTLHREGEIDHPNVGFLAWGAALSVSSFPIVTRLLADIKVLHTDMGRTAFSSAFLSDLGSWVLMIVVCASSSTDKEMQSWSLLTLTAFILLSIYIVRPAIKWLSEKMPEGEHISDLRVCMVLTFVLACGVATDAMGLYSVTGAFVFGLIMPKGELGDAVADRVEDLVSEILLPLYFTITGLRINLEGIFNGQYYALGLLTIVVACFAKIVTVIAVAYFQDMTIKEGTALGVLMNTKGIMAVVILNVAFERKMITQPEYAIMIISLAIMTILVSPVITLLYKPANRFIHYKRRTIQGTSSDSELRIIACIHETRHVSGIINLLEASNATPRSPIAVYALHLVELTGRTSSAMLIIHTTRKSGVHNSNRAKVQSDQIIDDLESYEQDTTANITIMPLTAMSPYSTMNEDISSLAVDKHVSFIIVPFHKLTTSEGKMEETNTEIRLLNQNLLDTAPCSVAIFIDRGFGALSRMEFSDVKRHIAMIYIGGADDREALCFAWRMAGHPNITLHVIRFIHSNTNVTSNVTREDIEFMTPFKQIMATDHSITYTEKMSNTGEDTVAILREMEHNYDLYIVGRGVRAPSPITSGLLDWSDCPELGAIGDILVSSEFTAAGSVLVMQQFKGDVTMTTTTPDSSGSGIREIEYDEYNSKSWRAGGEFDGGSESQFIQR